MNAANKFLLTVVAIATLAGCSLLPKQVEFFQDKVKKVPEHTAADKEVQKETADLAARKAQETYKAVLALGDDAAPEVLKPAEDTSLLTLSLSRSLGPPLNPWKDEAAVLASKLDRLEAKLDARMDKFAEKQDKNEGKKIEGTGLFQIPYFVWLGVVGVFAVGIIFVGFVVLQVVKMSNPAVSLGINGVSASASAVAKGFVQTVKGNESFKEEVKSLFGEADNTAKTILEIFKRHQMVNQDTDVQQTIKSITQK